MFLRRQRPHPQTPPTQIRILYDFAGSNEGELPVRANDVVFLVEDDGSGWALAAKVCR